MYETNQGYVILKDETYHTDPDGTEHRIVLGYLSGRTHTYCTWDSTCRGGGYSYFWGHCFMEDEAAARRDYHLRLAEKYERG